jgi:hypothetical protein
MLCLRLCKAAACYKITYRWLNLQSIKTYVVTRIKPLMTWVTLLIKCLFL